MFLFKDRKYHNGFSLVELLITLAIIGILAAFTIPPLFQVPASSRTGKQTAIARDVAFMLLGAFEQYRAAHPTISTMRSSDITPYLNYVSLDTSGTLVDNIPGNSSATCSASNYCFKLHNGGTLYNYTGDGFCNSGADPSGVVYAFDPDGAYSGTTIDGPSKAIRFYIYTDGYIRTEGNLRTNTRWNGWGGGGGQTCNYVRSAIPSSDPTWFTGF